VAGNEIKLSIRVDDNGSLSIVGQEAEAASDKLGNVTDASDKAGKSQNTLRRNLHGTAKMTSNSTKGFAKMSQGITGGLVPAYAVLASNIFALSAAFNFLKRAADVQILEESQIKFAQNSGIALASITQRLREASDGMLGFKEAGQAAAIGLAKGFTPQQLEALAVGARKASTALGRDFEDSFDRLIRGASKAEPELLDELGITLRLEEATENYARAIGKNRDELNSYQRSQAVLIETQRQLNKNFGDFEAATNPFVKLSKTFEDIIKKVTQFFLPIFTALADIISRSALAAVAVFAAIGIAIFKAMVPMDGFRERVKKMGEESKTAHQESKEALSAYIAKMKEAAAQAAATQKKGKAGMQTGAAAMVASGSKNKTLQKVASGETLSGLDKHNIAKAIKSAETQYKKHGEVRNGMFQGQNIKMVRDFDKSMKMMTVSGGRSFKRIAASGKTAAMAVVVSMKWMGVQSKAALIGMAKAADWLGGKLSKLISIASGIGIAVMLYEMGKQIAENIYSIGLMFSKVLDSILNFIAPFVNMTVKWFLGMVDEIIDAWNWLKTSVAKIVNKIASGIADGLSAAINKVIDGVNAVIAGVNMLPGWKDDPISPINNVDFAKSLTLMDESTKAASNLAASYEEVNESGDRMEQMYKNTIGGALYKFQEGMKRDKRNNANLKEYNDLLETSAMDLNNIIDARNMETDAVKKQRIAFSGLVSLGIPDLYAKINAQSTRVVTQLDGTKKKVKEYIMSEEGRVEALENLKLMLGDITELSPKMGEALSKATLDSDAGLVELATKVKNANTQLKAFEEGLTGVKQEVKESISSGSFRDAFYALKQLKDSATEAGTAISDLTNDKKQKALADLLDKFKEMFGPDMNADELLENLEKIVAATNRIEILEQTAAATTGKRRTLSEALAALEKNRLKISEKELQLKTESDKGKKEELRNELEILKTLERQHELRKNMAFQGMYESYGAGPEIGQIQATFLNLSTTLSPLAKRYAELNEKKREGIELTKEEQKELDRLKLQMMGMATTGFGEFLSTIGQSLKALGPEGEYMAGILNSTGQLISITGVFMEQLASGMEKWTEKLSAGLQFASGMLSVIQGILNAQSQQRIKQIDKEIAAEKKRDGKSKESLAKIQALEAKKEQQKKKAFEMNKKMVMAQIVLQTALGMISAFASGMMLGPILGPPAAAAFVAMVAAMGAATLAIAAGMSYQGGGGSADAPTPTASVATGQRKSTVDIAKSQSAAGELSYLRGEQGVGGPENFRGAFYGVKHRAEGGPVGYVVGEQGPELFMPNQAGAIVPNDDIAEIGGGTNVTFNISTIDASGVEDVLTQQQGNIIGMIRSAANEYGDPFLENIDTSIYSAPTAGYGRA